jgi:hypothetical protein
MAEPKTINYFSFLVKVFEGVDGLDELGKDAADIAIASVESVSGTDINRDKHIDEIIGVAKRVGGKWGKRFASAAARALLAQMEESRFQKHLAIARMIGNMLVQFGAGLKFDNAILNFIVELALQTFTVQGPRKATAVPVAKLLTGDELVKALAKRRR